MAASLTSLSHFSDTGLDASRLESIYWTPCAPSLDLQLDLDLSPTVWNFEYARSREGYNLSLIDISPPLVWRCPNGPVTPTSHAVTEAIASADKGPSTLPSAPPSSALIFSPSLTTPKADPETRNQKAALCEQVILPSNTSNDGGLATTAYRTGKSSINPSCNTKDSCIVSDTEARNGHFTSGSNPLAHSDLPRQSFPYTPSIGQYSLHDFTKSRSCNSKTTSSSANFTSSGSSEFWTHSKDDRLRNSGLLPFLSAALADATSSDIDADIPYSAHPSATSFISLLDSDWSFDEQIVLALLSARITRYREDSEPNMKRYVPTNRFAAIRLAARRISLTRLVATLSEKTTDIAKNCFIKASRWSTAIVRS
ncbi:hypothetical protein BDN70DRAFT_988583 [Pholiota conissans]|uniref:Uncharacterized protein n=1 Tax=Pholiota conissans TaxID=109636 RepID=A0A9P6D6J4_9AGAR|nr:hypothetical protein BDN70DRAFT_988583 [Pholiota conissans]